MKPGHNSEIESMMLRLFNHYRHDWMNDIQLLYGYVKLKKYDKLTELMEKIKDKVHQESCVSKLGIPHLILHILSFQSEVKELRFETRMEQEIQLQHVDQGTYIAETICDLLDAFREEAAASQEYDNQLVLTFRMTAAAQLEIAAQYQGGFRQEQLNAMLDRIRLMAESRYHAVFETVFQEDKVEWKMIKQGG